MAIRWLSPAVRSITAIRVVCRDNKVAWDPSENSPDRLRWRHKSGGFVVATALDTLHVCCMRKYMHVHANVHTLHVHAA